MRTVRYSILGVALGWLFAVSAGPASAELHGTSGCRATASFRTGGLTVDAAAIGDSVVTIRRHDSVEFRHGLGTLAEAHIAGRADHSRLLWQLLMLDRSLAQLGIVR